MKLTSILVENFAGLFLSQNYDHPAPVPKFHRECWDLYCSDARAVAIAAPRGHAKSSSLTVAFILASVCFRSASHVLILSASEDLAFGHLGDIAREFRDNEDLIQQFGIQSFTTESKGEIIVKSDDGHEFRILARGARQRLRGLKWNNKRPDLIVCDDLESVEVTETKDQRMKFARWVLRVMIPLLSVSGKVRWHGTILDKDSMLNRFMSDDTWVSRLYKAHRSFNDFSEILWPEQYNEAALREIRQRFINSGDGPGYAMEYLNDPIDNENAYIQSDWFLPLGHSEDEIEAVRKSIRIYGIAADFAISTRDHANRTSITVGGQCLNNDLCIVDQYCGRWDSLGIIDRIFRVAAKWNPDIFWVEQGQIWNSLYPMIRQEMQRRNQWINFIPRVSIKDKASRGRTFQKRMRAGSIKWDMEKDWFPDMQDEILHFTGFSEAQLDDQFDSVSLLCLGFATMQDLSDEYDSEFPEEDDRPFIMRGQSPVTGY